MSQNNMKYALRKAYRLEPQSSYLCREPVKRERAWVERTLLSAAVDFVSKINPKIIFSQLPQ